MFLRKYEATDCPYLAELFYDTVHTVNAKDYTKAQLNAWANGNVDLENWNSSYLNNFTIVAIDHGVIVGFGDITPAGYLDHLFVHKDYQHHGIATAICDKLESSVAGNCFTTHASITARPFFEKRGYKVIKKQQVKLRGAVLTNYVMEKSHERIL